MHVNDNTTLAGRNISIQGFSSAGPGMFLNDAVLTASGNLTLQGRSGSGASGVLIQGASLLTAAPATVRAPARRC